MRQASKQLRMGLLLNLILLLSFMLHSIPSIAQSPGGVSGCEAWFATSPIGNDRNGTYHWEELTGDSVLLRYVGGSTTGTEVTEPRSSIQSFNFHPALRFSVSSGFMDAVLRHGSLAEATFVGVFLPDSLPSTDTRLYAVSGKDASAMTQDKALHSGETAALDYSPDLLHGQQSATAMNVTQFYGDDIMGGEGQPKAGGIWGNLSGHQVTDNDEYIKKGQR